MSTPEHFAPVAARWLATLNRQENTMTDTDLPLGFGRRNVHCANCGDERGGPFGHETSECRYRSGMTAGDVAAIQPEERRREFWSQAIDRYLRSQGIDPEGEL